MIPEVANPLTARMHKGINTTADEGQTPIVTHSLRGVGFDASEDGTGRGTPIIAAPLAAGSGGAGRRREDDENLVAFAQNQRDEVRLMEKAGDLAAEPGAKQQTYVFKGGQGSSAGSIGGDENVSPTLGSADSGSNRTPVLMQGMAVRRLTPLECERLQGFPDGYTAIPMQKRNRSAETKEMIEYFKRTGQDAAIRAGAHMAPDSPRYKALGNSMAVPVMRWIGERIAAQAETEDEK